MSLVYVAKLSHVICLYVVTLKEIFAPEFGIYKVSLLKDTSHT